VRRWRGGPLDEIIAVLDQHAASLAPPERLQFWETLLMLVEKRLAREGQD
jgi:hypothetical protein